MRKLLLLALLYTTNANAQNVPSYIDTNGLISWHSFTNTSLVDSFNNRVANANDVWYETDRFNNPSSCIYTHKYGEGPLSGKSYVDLGNYGINTDFTISIWSKLSNNVAGAYLISSYACVASEIVGIGYDSDSSYFKFGNFYITTTDKLNNNWHHFVAIVNKDTGYLYIDDTLRGKRYINHSPNLNPDISKLNLGFYANGNIISTVLNSNNGKTNYNGHIDDVGIWNKALTRQQVTDLYKTIQVPASAAIKDLNAGSELIVSPNPATNFITIKSSKVIESIEIINLYGQVIFERTYNANVVNIHLEALATGQYIIRINGTTKHFQKN